MSKFKRELNQLLELAFLEENEPVQLTFNNRIYKKYGSEFNKKYDYISGKNIDYIREKLKSQKPITQIDRVAHSAESSILSSLQSYNELEKENQYAPMMYVPEEIKKEWVASNTQKYFLNDETKRELVEEYLASLSQENRARAVTVMCENSNSKNYLRFLDLSTTAYTPNQEILANDLINYFHNKYLNEQLQREYTRQRYNQNVFNSISDYDVKNDELYNKAVKNKGYYNPYDKKEMLTAKVAEENNLFNDKERIDAFNRIDYNLHSKMYLKQQQEFKNEHLDKANIRKEEFIQQKFIPRREFSNQEISQEKEKQYIDAYDYAIKDLNASESYIMEIPKVKNIAEFLEQRTYLNQQNALRKHYNISTAINENNQLVGTNIKYNATKPIVKQKSFEKTITLNNELTKGIKITQQEALQESIATPSNITQQKSNLEMIKSSITNNQNINMDGFNVNQLNTAHHVATIGEIKSASRQVPVSNIAFNSILKNHQQNNQLTASQFMQKNYNMINQVSTGDASSRVRAWNDIQKFLNQKTNLVKEKGVEKLPVVKQKVSKNNKKQTKTNSNTNTNNKNRAMVVKTIKINRAINLVKQQEISEQKQTKKTVLV